VIFLAIRHLLSRFRQTLLTLMGIVLGTAAYVVISGMMLGFQTYMIDQMVNNDSHVRITAREEIITEHSLDDQFFGFQPKEGSTQGQFDGLIQWKVPPSGRRDNASIEYPQGWFERLDQDPTVLAYSQQLVIQIIAKRAKIAQSARMIGCDPMKQARVTNLQDYMLQGNFQDIGQTGNRVLVGDGLLKKLGARNSETILLSSGKGSLIPFKIVGVFHIGIKGIDDSTLFAALADVQNLNQTPSRISDIAVRLTHVEDAAEKASSWSAFHSDKVQSWDQANEGIMSVFKTQDIVRNAMTFSILIVAGFGIYNILNMSVIHKRREIAILRSIGFEQRDIQLLFSFQGLILGIVGGVVGLLIGYLGCLYLGAIEVSPDRMIGSGTMLISYNPTIYLKGFLVALFSTGFASWLPARAAGRMTPIEIIRSEAS
jgi:lipoprotein-releasing system permease protein